MEALTSLLFIGLLLWLAYGPWQSYCVDVARQRMFGVRDKLFDMAADEKLSFDDKAYRDMRRLINACIRFAHRMTWVEILAIALAVRGRAGRPDTLDVVLDSIADPTTKKAVERLQGRLSLVVFALVIVRSPLLFVLAAPLIIFLAFRSKSRFSKKVKDETQRMGKFVVRETEIAEMGDMCPAH